MFAAVAPVGLVMVAAEWFVMNFGALAARWRGFDAPTKLAVSALLFAWLIYRLSQASQRDGVVHGLRKELELHRNWTGAEYPPEEVPEGAGWDSPWYGVYRLSTVALDNAIAQGPGLFLSRALVELIVGYRQRVQHVNQLIDAASAYQVALAAHWTDYLVERIRSQTAIIHWQGIGDRTHRAAHFHYYQTCLEFYAETHAPISFAVWLLSGVRVYVAERWIYRLAWRLFRLP